MQYNKPPLAFMGNKRNMLKHIKEVLHTLQCDGFINNQTLFLDVFGGSGLIAHNIKQWYPSNSVVWNDFDNYQKRLDHIQITEQLRAKIYAIVKGLRDDKIQDKHKQEILAILQDFEDRGAFIDYITLSTYLLFSGNYVDNLKDFSKNTFYNRVTREPLQSRGYLVGVQRVQQDFKELLDSYAPIKNKVLILDPPYLQTQKGNYKAHFGLGQFFELIKRVAKPYLYFGSDNSDILEAFAYLKAYNKDLENYTFNTAFLTLGDKNVDYILYPQGRSLFH